MTFSGRVTSGLVMGLSSALTLTSVYAIWKYSYHVPYWDMIPSLYSYFSESLLTFLFEPENEHIHVTAKIFYILDILLARGSGRLVILSMVAVIGVLAWVMACLAGDQWRHRLLFFCLALAALTGTANYENLLWPKQIHLYLSLMFFVLAAALTISPLRSPVNQPLIIGAVLTSVLSFGYGLMAAVLVPVLCWLRTARPVLCLPLALGAAFSIFLWLALLHFGLPADDPTLSASLARPAMLLAYLLHFLGAPWLPVAPALADILAGLAILFSMVQWLAAIRAAPIAQADRLLGLALTAFGAGNALTTALTRAHFGAEQAATSRYLAVVWMFWIGVALLLPPARNKTVQAVLPAALLAVITAGQISSWPAMIDQANTVRWLEIGLLNRIQDRSLLLADYGNPAAIERTAEVFQELSRRRLAPFSGPETTWQGGLVSDIATIRQAPCPGYVDQARLEGSDHPFLRLSGWAYAGPPSRALLVADGAGRVAGLGLAVGDRPDVTLAMPAIPAEGIGWAAAVAHPAPEMHYHAYALTENGSGLEACSFGDSFTLATKGSTP